MEEKKINLDTDLREVYSQFTRRLCNILESVRQFADDTDFTIRTIRALCQLTRKDLFRWRCVGPKSIGEIGAFLEKYGLRLGMSQRELAEYEGKPYIPQVSQKIDNIDWEARTWELVSRFYTVAGQWVVPSSEYTKEGADSIIEMATTLVERYKERFFNNSNN